MFRIHHFYNLDEETSEHFRQIRCELGELKQMMERLMSTFDDLKAAQAETLNQVAKVKGDVEALLAKLAAIPTGGLTTEQQAALDDAVSSAIAINTSLAGVDSEANPAPPAPPAQ